MELIRIKVKSYPKTNVRSYFPDAKVRLCDQDGIVFREEKLPHEGDGVVTFYQVTHKRVGFRIMGWFAAAIVQVIARSRLRKNFVEGRFVSASQLNVEFKGVAPEKVDRLIGKAIGSAFNMRPVIAPIKSLSELYPKG